MAIVTGISPPSVGSGVDIKKDKIYFELKREWHETGTTKCYKCGKKINDWDFDYAYLHGRVCKQCLAKKKK